MGPDRSQAVRSDCEITFMGSLCSPEDRNEVGKFGHCSNGIRENRMPL